MIARFDMWRSENHNMSTGMPPTDPERLERERLDADRRYNAALTDLDRAIVELAAAPAPAPATHDLARLSTALIVFLQQITAFVDTKDRQIAADAERRIEALSPAVESIAE